MDSIAVTKPDMGVLSRERLPLSPFGVLAQAFAEEVARLSVRHFQMPSPERDPEKLRLQLRRLREESILSGEEVRELEEWYAIAGEERPNIGFFRKEDV